MPRKREWVLLALVAVAIFLAVAAPDEDADSGVAVAQAAPARKAQASRVPDDFDLDFARPRREVPAEEPANAFESKSWYVPPPSPPPPPVVQIKPAPPPPPAAPPLPFTFLGLYQDAAKPVIFLVRGDRVLMVSAGEVIEGTYRVEGIVGTTLAITYLPLNIRQSLAVGNAG
jgi:hypothetical protein